MRPSFFHHLHPPTIPSRQARLRYTLAAGGLAVVLGLVLLVTGLLEMFYYIPDPEKAAASIQTITFLVPFGGLVRNLHYWSAQFLVIVTLVHLLRVVLTGAYAPPRRVNYLIGLGLLVLALLLDFTGYVLRWDQGIHWALVTGTNLVKTIPLAGNFLHRLLVGGAQPGAATLVRFYGWHVFGLALLGGILVTWHIFRVRRDGGIALPPPALREDLTRIRRGELVRREVLAMLLALAALILLAAFAPAPLAAPLNASATASETARAPWFFLWVQWMLRLGSPFWWGVAVPLGVLVLLAAFPYLLPRASRAELGRWFPQGNRLAQAVVILLGIAVITLTVLALQPAP
jgi:quinol-cytochrome oxidoreductase complex cytochrome b subunit